MTQNQPTGRRLFVPSCSLYYRKNEFFVVSITQIRHGSIESEPVFHTKDLREVGDLVMQSLASKGYRPEYVLGTDYDPNALMKPYGFDSRSKFLRGTTMILVIKEEDKLNLTKYKPKRGRISGTKDDPDYFCDANAESLVRLVAQLLELPDPFAE